MRFLLFLLTVTLCSQAAAWEVCFSIRTRIVTVCDLPPTYVVGKRDRAVNVYPRPSRDVWRDGVVVKEWDEPLFTVWNCPVPQYQKAATSVAIKCA